MLEDDFVNESRSSYHLRVIWRNLRLDFVVACSAFAFFPLALPLFLVCRHALKVFIISSGPESLQG